MIDPAIVIARLEREKAELRSRLNMHIADNAVLRKALAIELKRTKQLQRELEELKAGDPVRTP